MKKKGLALLIFLVLIPKTHWAYNDINKNSINSYNYFYSIVLKSFKSDSWLQVLKALDKKLIKMSNDWSINSQNAKSIYDFQKLNNEKIFEIELKKEEDKNKKSLDSFKVLSWYTNFSYNTDFVFKEQWIWYYYDFKEVVHFENDKYLNKESLKYNWLDDKNVLIFYEDNKIKFVKDYTVKKIISDNFIYWFPNKKDLLVTLRNNKVLWNKYDDDAEFRKLEILSLNLTDKKYKNEEKIAIIYDYILDNIEYTNNPDLSDFKISSWIETWKNKTWVCEWYIELMQLMLWFNNVPVDLKPWDVIDAPDFPYIWHWWVKIFDYYYDPTFDDPIWNTKAKTKQEYEYYKLPRDLLYTDRFDMWETPEYLKKASIEERQTYIRQQRANVYPKYKNDDYNLLKPYKFKEKNWIPLNTKITINALKNKVDYWEFDWKNLKINWQSRVVSSMKYAEIDDNNIEVFLDMVSYDFSDYMLIQWSENWTQKYIAAKKDEIEYQ